MLSQMLMMQLVGYCSNTVVQEGDHQQTQRDQQQREKREIRQIHSNYNIDVYT
jgi:hypothetical protein